MTTSQPTTLHCANHPNRETLLRCNHCEKPICLECAVQTPTGFRCKECIRSQQKIFVTAKTQDYFFAFFLAGILSYIGSLLVNFIGFFSILLAPAAGFVIAEAVRKVTGRRRSKSLFQVAAVAAALGAVVNLLPVLFLIILGAGGLGNLLGFIWPIVYAAIVCTTVYANLSGIRIK
jgi:hypothetical protein